MNPSGYTPDFDDTHELTVSADRTVENMIAAVENVENQIADLIHVAKERGTSPSAQDALNLISAIKATYATLLPK